MAAPDPDEKTKPANGEARPATLEDSGDNPSFFGELLYFLKKNKKWWMVPMLISLLLFGLLLLLSGTAAAPFIYTLF
jgi:hypothetical protein